VRLPCAFILLPRVAAGRLLMRNVGNIHVVQVIAWVHAMPCVATVDLTYRSRQQHHVQTVDDTSQNLQEIRSCVPIALLSVGTSTWKLSRRKSSATSDTQFSVGRCRSQGPRPTVKRAAWNAASLIRVPISRRFAYKSLKNDLKDRRNGPLRIASVPPFEDALRHAVRVVVRLQQEPVRSPGRPPVIPLEPLSSRDTVQPRQSTDIREGQGSGDTWRSASA